MNYISEHIAAAAVGPEPTRPFRVSGWVSPSTSALGVVFRYFDDEDRVPWDVSSNEVRRMFLLFCAYAFEDVVKGKK